MVFAATHLGIVELRSCPFRSFEALLQPNVFIKVVYVLVAWCLAMVMFNGSYTLWSYQNTNLEVNMGWCMNTSTILWTPWMQITDKVNCFTILMTNTYCNLHWCLLLSCCCVYVCVHVCLYVYVFLLLLWSWPQSNVGPRLEDVLLRSSRHTPEIHCQTLWSRKNLRRSPWPYLPGMDDAYTIPVYQRQMYR